MVEVELTGDFSPKTASMQIVAPGSLRARNTLEKPTAVKAEVGTVTLTGQRLSFDLPAYSAAVVRAN
jgi:alpha-L-arabinofuranosidase